jgi:hypothetical protein
MKQTTIDISSLSKVSFRLPKPAFSPGSEIARALPLPFWRKFLKNRKSEVLPKAKEDFFVNSGRKRGV